MIRSQIESNLFKVKFFSYKSKQCFSCRQRPGAKIDGEFCQCDNTTCPREQGKICNGNIIETIAQTVIFEEV